MTNRTDIVVGLQYGDEGKGKIVNYLASTYKYDYCLRYNGGANAGHTIYINNTKIVTHQIPTGFIYGVKSIICDNCYLDIDKLINEINYIKLNCNHLKSINFDNLLISENCHLIMEEYKENDDIDGKIGTTKSGIGPCAIKKYGRNGKILRNCKNEIKKLLDLNIGIKIINTTDYFMKFNRYKLSFLVEGAQGFGLDINHGDYPYVTSSHCISTDCFNIGIPFKNKENYQLNVWGISKIYETYVGAKNFNHPDYENNEEYLNNLSLIQKQGNEFGATTERPRKCNYLNLNYLIKSIWINQVDILYFNKCDILKEVNIFSLFWNDVLVKFETIDDMIDFIINKINENTELTKDKIHFQFSAEM